MFSLLRSLPASASTSVSRAFSTSSALLAHKKGAGSTKNNRGSIGKRLGVKKFADEIVQPGDIITRQRGTKIHAGQNVGVGRDHTLFALTPGYLKFYSLPHHPNRPTMSPNIPNRKPPRSSVAIPDTNRPKGYRRYVGITLRKNDKLPRDERKLGRERLWFGTVEPESGDRTWQWQEEGPAGEGRFVRTDAGAPAPREGKADAALEALVAGEGPSSSAAAESSDARP